MSDLDPSGPHARLRFLGDCQIRPRFHGRQRHLDNLPLVDTAVPIENGRVGTAPCLDREGFVLARAPTAARDLMDMGKRRSVYLPELEALVAGLTGAVRTVALDSSVVRRSERAADFGKPGATVPGRFVHCDYSPGPAGSLYWLHRALGPAAADWRGDFAIFNVWRPLSPPPQDTPLALCDVRSLGPSDRVATDCVNDPFDGPEVVFEMSTYRHSPGQRWLYYPDMTIDEVLIFRGFDSRLERGDGVPHAAFDDPGVAEDAPARVSIDERVLALFAP